MHGAADIELQLRALSGEGWEPINFARDEAGRYEVILRREETPAHEAAVLERLEAAAEIEPPSLAS